MSNQIVSPVKFHPNRLIIILIYIIFSMQLSAQVPTNPGAIVCDIPPPYSDAIMADIDNDVPDGCGGSSTFFTVDELQSALEQTPSGLLSGIEVTDENKYAVGLANVALENMTMQDLYQCFGIGCDSHMDMMQSQIDQLIDIFSALSSSDVFQQHSNDIVGPGTGLEQDTTMGDFFNIIGEDPNQWAGSIANALSNVDLSEVLAEAFGNPLPPSSCDFWDNADACFEVDFVINDSDCTVQAVPSSGLPPFSYEWSNGITANQISVTSGNMYAVTITDKEGCQRVASSIIECGDECSDFNVSLSTGNGDAGCYIQANVSGGTQPYNYTWSPPSGSVFPGLLFYANGGEYVVTVTDELGCTISRSIEVGNCIPGVSSSEKMSSTKRTRTIKPTLSRSSKLGKQSLISQLLRQSEGSNLRGSAGSEPLADPNWFLGEIEGLGILSNQAPNPNATSIMNAVNAGVNLYNGTGSFSMALDNISANDVSMPIGIGGSAGGTKVDDLQSTLGNMNLNTGGMITRSVRGLPDEFKGNIDGYAYGYKRGLKPVLELTGINVKLDLPQSMNLFKSILCKIIKIVLEQLLGGMPGLIEKCGLTNDIFDKIDDTVHTQLGNLIENLFNKTQDKKQLAKKNSGVSTFNIFYNSRTPNYINIDINIIIPIGSAELIISFPFRAGLKMFNVPSPVKIQTTGVGAKHITSDLSMQQFDPKLGALNLEQFLTTYTDVERVQYLQGANKEKKRDDKEFFRPKAHFFAELFDRSFWREIFNIEDGEVYPRYKNKQLDTELDEFHFDFPGYSGKFIFKNCHYYGEKTGDKTKKIPEEEKIPEPPNTNTCNGTLDPDGWTNVLGLISTIPYYDFDFRVKYLSDGITIDAFEITTPEGIRYVFDKKETTSNVHFTLPTYFQYKGKDLIGRSFFEEPTLAREEIPVYRFFMGLPRTLDKPKDYMTNYHVELGEEYTSTWHLSKVESKLTKEKITLEYETREITYNNQKNWTHTFPNFMKDGNTNVTKPNSDLTGSVLRKENWKNGFADLTYSVSETTTQKQLLKTINNHRGKKALFIYNKINKATPGDKLCTRVEIQHNNQFFKAWEFDYDTPKHHNPFSNINCNNDDYSGAQSPALSDPKEYRLKFKIAEKEDNLKFLYRFYSILEIFCIQLAIPIEYRIDIGSKLGVHYFMDEVSELGSLFQVKRMLNQYFEEDTRIDALDIKRYQGEFIRYFLKKIKEVDAGGERHEVATLAYNNENQLADLPKRFGIEQDIWGYYNGSGSSNLPFIDEQYYDMGGKKHQTSTVANLGFFHPDNPSNTSRNWQASLNHAKIGQLKHVNMETGASFGFNYNLQQYPSSGFGVLYGANGGLRIESQTKNSGNGVTQTTNYNYSGPTVVNTPLFTFQAPIDVYYKGYEQRVKSSWKPLNHWYMNKGGYVGYQYVTESFNGGADGSIEHHYTSPVRSRGNAMNIPKVQSVHNINLVLRKPEYDTDEYPDILTKPLLFNPSSAYPWQPILSYDWRYGLETFTRVRDANGNEKQQSSRTYHFQPMSSTRYPTSRMYQYTHYGSFEEKYLEQEVYNFVDKLLCSDNTIVHLINLLASILHLDSDLLDLKHPYKYIERDYLFSMVELLSEKVEVSSEQSITTLTGGTQTSNTAHTYHGNDGRNLASTETTFSDGNSTKEEYYYPDNDGNIPSINLMDNTTIVDLKEANFNGAVETRSYLNGTLVGGNVTGYSNSIETGLLLPESTWSVKNQAFRLTGKFSVYDNGMPAQYELAKHLINGDPTKIESYSFLPPIIMDWNDQLQLAGRTYIDFGIENQYNDLFQLVKTTDASNIVTDYYYDDRRRLRQTVGSNGKQTTTYDYIMSPLTVTQTTDFTDGTPSQGVTQISDGFGNPISTTRNDGTVLSTVTYDNMFRPITSTALGKGTTTTVYEPSPIQRATSVTDAVDNVTLMEYLAGGDGFGGVKTTDPNGAITYAWSDALGRNIKQVDGEGGETSFTYDPLGRLDLVQPPSGPAYDYEYTERNLISSKFVPGGGTTQYFYDDKDRLVLSIDEKGTQIAMEYDEYNRPTRSGFYDASPPEQHAECETVVVSRLLTTTSYQDLWVKETTAKILLPNGNIGAETVTTTNTYDDLGRVTKVNNQAYKATNSIDNQYNDANLVYWTKISHNGPRTITQVYDNEFDHLLRPDKSYLSFETEQKFLLSAIGYDGEDRVVNKQLGAPSGVLQAINFNYDAIGRLKRIYTNGTVADKTTCSQNTPLCDAIFDEAADFLGTPTPITAQFGMTIEDITINDQCIDDLQVMDLPNYPYVLVLNVSKGGGFSTDGASNGLSATFKANTLVQDIKDWLDGRGLIYDDVQLNYTLDGTIENPIVNFQIEVLQSNAGVYSINYFHENASVRGTFEKENCCSHNGDGDNPTSIGLYDQTMSYDGLDIEYIEWQSSCTDKQRYDFTYDFLHRVKNADHTTFESIDGTIQSILNRYTTSYNYDAIGNITNLTRQGLTGFEPSSCTYNYGEIDNLTYGYGENGIRLSNVTDNAPSEGREKGFKPSSAGGDYTYDENGNLTSDPNKGITAIEYNHLNLPRKISFVGGEIIEFTYDAAGTKHQKKTIDAEGKEVVYDYIGGIEYKNEKLQAVYHAEGRITPPVSEDDTSPNDNGGWTGQQGTTSYWKYEYSITDHLGNTRISFSDLDASGQISTDEVLQQQHYYPFGMNMEGAWDGIHEATINNPYQYNGKEVNEDFGLNLHDYGARWYDASIARWNAVDALAEHPDQINKSVYAYAWNNPIALNDPDGNCPLCIPIVIKAIKTFAISYAANVGTQTVINSIANYAETGKVDIKKSFEQVDQIDATVQSLPIAKGYGIIKNVVIPSIVDGKSNGTISITGADILGFENDKIKSKPMSDTFIDLGFNSTAHIVNKAIDSEIAYNNIKIKDAKETMKKTKIYHDKYSKYGNRIGAYYNDPIDGLRYKHAYQASHKVDIYNIAKRTVINVKSSNKTWKKGKKIVKGTKSTLNNYTKRLKHYGPEMF